MDENATPNWLDDNSENMPSSSEKTGMVFQSSVTNGLGEAKPALSQSNVTVKVPRGARVFLNVVVLLWMITVVGFYAQNSTRLSIFPDSPAHRAALAEQGLLQVKAEILVQNHVAAVLLLDEISSLTDALGFDTRAMNSDAYSQNKQLEFKADAETVQANLTERLQNLKDALSTPASEEEEAQAESILKDFVDRQEGSADANDDTTRLLSNIQDFESARALLKNKEFKDQILAIDPQDWELSELESLMTAHAQVSRSVQALISQIRGERHDFKSDWSQMERLIKSVDPLFNTEFSGTLRLDKLSLNRSGAVSLSGNSDTQDGKNFTLLSNLVDTLENSPLFADVTQRNYTKSASEQMTQGAFALTMTLETHE